MLLLHYASLILAVLPFALDILEECPAILWVPQTLRNGNVLARNIDDLAIPVQWGARTEDIPQDILFLRFLI